MPNPRLPAAWTEDASFTTQTVADRILADDEILRRAADAAKPLDITMVTRSLRQPLYETLWREVTGRTFPDALESVLVAGGSAEIVVWNRGGPHVYGPQMRELMREPAEDRRVPLRVTCRFQPEVADWCTEVLHASTHPSDQTYTRVLTGGVSAMETDAMQLPIAAEDPCAATIWTKQQWARENARSFLIWIDGFEADPPLIE